MKIGTYVQTMSFNVRAVDGTWVEADKSYLWAPAIILGFVTEKGTRSPRVFKTKAEKTYNLLRLGFADMTEHLVPSYAVRNQANISELFKFQQGRNNSAALTNLLAQVEELKARINELEVVEERSPKSSDFRIEELREAVEQAEDFGIIAAAMAEAQTELPPLG